jgi:hypothetical protein
MAGYRLMQAETQGFSTARLATGMYLLRVVDNHQLVTIKKLPVVR